MLAAHRDQENLAHSHQAPAKQQHKTPGARFPKTPSRYPHHDENAPTAFAGKTALGGASKFGGDKTIMKAPGTRQALVTPMGRCTSYPNDSDVRSNYAIDGRSRAPLGNKTTNAKAKTGQVIGAKGFVKDVERTQVKPTTTQKQKQKSADVAPIDFKVETQPKDRNDVEEEPEYAPPRPKDLPYESDVFPDGLLNLEGLKDENLFKGYYQHFFNPVDDHGVSKQDREFEETMKKVMDQTDERNQQELDALDWNIADLDSPETVRVAPRPAPSDERQPVIASRPIRRAPSRKPSTLTSRRAASALSVHSDTTRSTEGRPASQALKTRKPLSSLLQGKKPLKNAPLKTSAGARAVGEVASRTTIGYSKGRSASSMLQTRPGGPVERTQRGRTVKPSTSIESGISDLTITPARLRQAAVARKQESVTRPQFMSIFNTDDEEEDLPPMSQPLHFSDDEDEEFELKIDI